MTAYAAALAVGALAGLRAGEVIDTVDCQRSRRAIKRELRAAAAPWRQSVLGEEAMSTAVFRCVNDLLGPRAETVGDQFQAVEEVIRHRTRGGPALWHLALDEWAGRAGLPPEALASLHETAERITRAETELRASGILGPHELVPSLLATYWGHGVHLTRGAIAVGWLDRGKGLDFLHRAGELADRWYPSTRSLIAAQLLPAYFCADTDTINWAASAIPPLLADPRSPLTLAG